jgi:hypothetical protein
VPDTSACLQTLTSADYSSKIVGACPAHSRREPMNPSILAFTLLMVLACNSPPEGGNQSGPARTDSAGVVFVRNPFDSLRGDGSLAVSEVRRIGAVEGEQAYLLAGVSDLLLDDDLTVYVASKSAGTIRVFGPDGKLERSGFP